MPVQRQKEFLWQKRVLVVESDVAALGMFRAAFENQSLLVSVRTTPSSVYAFEIALKEEFDLFLFAESLPKIEGGLLYELLGKVYENSRPLPRRLPPMLVLTANAASPEVRRLLAEPGVLGCLRLPPDPDEIRKRVLLHLGGARRQPGT